MQIAGAEALDHLGEFLGHRFRLAHDDIVDRLKLLVAHANAQTAAAGHVPGGALRLHFDCLTRLVARRVVVLSWASLTMAHLP